MKESARYILPILVFVALILSIGTGGYLLIEDGITASDAFYMTVTAITPTQFDEVHELSVRGRYFTVVLVFCGFGAVVAFATQFARLIVQSELEGVGVITRKQMGRRIRRMKNHYIVCGFGGIGEAICAELQEQQFPFVVITDDETSVTAIHREGYALVRGNPTADLSLKEAGIESAQGVISVLSDDAENLFISLAARELNPKIFIIARGESANLEDRILRAGADIVVSPMKLGGRQIAELIKQQAGTALSGEGAAAQANVMGLRLKVYRNTADEAVSIERVLAESGAIGVAEIQRKDGSLEPNPPSTAELDSNETAVLITRTSESIPPVHQQPSGRTILLADDHRALRLLFSRKLASAGHEVIQASRGDEALRMALAHAPDLIILDVNMPRPNGYEVCETLRQSENFLDVPIILYSGDETDEFLQRGEDAGADRCIRKTSKSSDLLAQIEEVFLIRDDTESSKAERNEPTTTGESPEPGSQRDAFDLDVVLENVGGDPALVDELIGAMLEESPRLMKQIDAAMATRDLDSVRGAAHAIKGAVSVFGAHDASAAAARLELAASEPDSTKVDSCHSELQERMDTLVQSFKDRQSTIG